MPWPAFKAPSRRGQHGNAVALLVFPLPQGYRRIRKLCGRVAWLALIGSVPAAKGKRAAYQNPVAALSVYLNSVTFST